MIETLQAMLVAITIFFGFAHTATPAQAASVCATDPAPLCDSYNRLMQSRKAAK